MAWRRKRYTPRIKFVHNLPNKPLSDFEDLQNAENNRSNLQDIQNTVVADSSELSDTILMRVHYVCSLTMIIRGMSSAFGWNWIHVAAVTGVKRLEPVRLQRQALSLHQRHLANRVNRQGVEIHLDAAVPAQRKRAHNNLALNQRTAATMP